MDVYEFDYNSFPELKEEIVLCLGFFDGIHLGHQALIEEAKKYGKKVGVLSFSNSVYNFQHHEKNLLTPQYKKIKLFGELGVDYYFEVEMSQQLLDSTAEEWMKKIKALKPAICVCGSDYTFGHNKVGDVDLLSKYFVTKVVPYECFDGDKISSKDIYKALTEGNIGLANRLLGRHYSVKGRVVRGLRNGTRLGYPTANLQLFDFCFMPREGVYFGKVKLYDEEYNAIASYGTHPTIDELDTPLLEIHLLNFNEDIYGDRMEFEFLEFVRPNVKFETERELISELFNDRMAAKDFFAEKDD